MLSKKFCLFVLTSFSMPFLIFSSSSSLILSSLSSSISSFSLSSFSSSSISISSLFLSFFLFFLSLNSFIGSFFSFFLFLFFFFDFSFSLLLVPCSKAPFSTSIPILAILFLSLLLGIILKNLKLLNFLYLALIAPQFAHLLNFVIAQNSFSKSFKSVLLVNVGSYT